MKLTVLGANGPFPAPQGATSGYLVTASQTRLVMDLGSGTLSRLTALTAPEDLSALILTHWHYDHCSDLLPLMYRLQSAGRTLKVYAPVDETSAVRRAALADSTLEVINIFPGDRFCVGEIELEVAQARHPVPAVMLRLTGDGRSLVYTGDTNTVGHLVSFAAHADLLLADGLFTRELWSEGKPHLSAYLAARAAADAKAGALVITHLNPTIDDRTLLRQAREAYPAVRLAAPGSSYEV